MTRAPVAIATSDYLMQDLEAASKQPDSRKYGQKFRLRRPGRGRPTRLRHRLRRLRGRLAETFSRSTSEGSGNL